MVEFDLWNVNASGLCRNDKVVAYSLQGEKDAQTG
jgi:hypothetical protein